MVETKGVTPVVATVLLMTIVVGSVSTFYIVYNDALQESEPEVALQISDLAVDTCYRENLNTVLVVRNPNNQLINASRSELYVNGEFIEKKNTSKQLVEQGETYRLYLPLGEDLESSDTIELGYRGERFNVVCRDFTRAGSTDAIEEGGDSISELRLMGNITPRENNLCIGDTCPEDTGNVPTSKFDTANTYVNTRGDAVNGSLTVGSAVFGPDTCIGDKCAENPGSGTGFLTGMNNQIEGTLIIDSLKSNSLCFGSNC